MSAPEVGAPTPDLLGELTEALKLEAFGEDVRVTFAMGMALRDGDLRTVVQARVEQRTETETASGRSKVKWVPVGLPLCPPEGEGLPELLELLAMVARGQQ